MSAGIFLVGAGVRLREAGLADHSASMMVPSPVPHGVGIFGESVARFR
jgi:hypothetical protein